MIKKDLASVIFPLAEHTGYKYSSKNHADVNPYLQGNTVSFPLESYSTSTSVI